MTSPTPLLDKITNPADLRKLPSEDLRQLADELRPRNHFGCVGNRRASGRGAWGGGADRGPAPCFQHA